MVLQQSAAFATWFPAEYHFKWCSPDITRQLAKVQPRQGLYSKTNKGSLPSSISMVLQQSTAFATWVPYRVSFQMVLPRHNSVSRQGSTSSGALFQNK